MTAVFAHVVQHSALARDTPFEGRVVLSEMDRGDSAVYCGAPSLKYVLDGEERYEVDGRIRVVTPGQFLLVDAGVRLRAMLPRRGRTVGLCVYLPTGGLTPNRPLADAEAGTGERDADPFAGRTLLLSAATAPWGRQLVAVARALSEDPSQGPRVADRIARVTARVMDEVLTEASGHLGRLSAEKPSTRRSLLERVERVRGRLHDQLTGTVTLDELAALAGMSQFHLARTFRVVHGEPIGAYHRRLKLDRAARLLATDAMAATQVAGELGFSDAAAFSRSFKRRFGVAPGAYRSGRR
jgi:AraC-like DNA-binding protein/quercetin dioxygenase-like cupin family protein